METQSEMKPVSMPRIGDKAPAFKAVTTQGEIDFPAQYSGSWVILFSHPADFTPVCTSEFITFASMEDKFAEANCKLVGLSVDGLYSHIAWLRTIKEKIEYRGMKDVEVNFPLIEDITMEVWQVDYHRVWGMKAGDSLPTGTSPLPEILICPNCGESLSLELVCGSCHANIHADDNGIVDLVRLE